MPGLVSICLLTCERPQLVVKAVESCLAQTYREIEIVIGDDTRGDQVTRALEPYLHDERIRYVHHPTRLGQADNANRLFDLARGERLLLLHDDDLLVPDAIEVLDRCWQEYPGLLACYGKQLVISHTGQPLPDRTAAYDRRFYRTSEHAGLQKSKLWAALVAQMPPDTAMVRSEATRATRLRPYEEVGDDCDYDFILRLTKQPGEFYMADRYLTYYRITDESLSSKKNVDHVFRLWRDIELPPELEGTRLALMKEGAPYATYAYLLSGQRAQAWEVIRTVKYWPAAWSAPRIKAFAAMLVPAPLLRAYHAARATVGKLVRRSDAIYRLIWTARRARSS